MLKSVYLQSDCFRSDLAPSSVACHGMFSSAWLEYLRVRLFKKVYIVSFEMLAVLHIFSDSSFCMGGALASWLVYSSPDRAVRVRVLAGDIVLCSSARHFTLTVPLSTQVYKRVSANSMLVCNPTMD